MMDIVIDRTWRPAGDPRSRALRPKLEIPICHIYAHTDTVILEQLASKHRIHVAMLTATGITEIHHKLKHYNYVVKELQPTETVTGTPGFIAVKDGVTVNFDGQLYINNEPVDLPNGERFDINLQEHVEWFVNNFELLRLAAGEPTGNDPTKVG